MIELTKLLPPFRSPLFCNWVEEQSMIGNLPEMPEGCEAQALTVLTPGFMLDATMENAFYQVQLQQSSTRT